MPQLEKLEARRGALVARIDPRQDMGDLAHLADYAPVSQQSRLREPMSSQPDTSVKFVEITARVGRSTNSD